MEEEKEEKTENTTPSLLKLTVTLTRMLIKRDSAVSQADRRNRQKSKRSR